MKFGVEDIRIAAVVPRFGRDLGGGAEALVRGLVVELQRRGSAAGRKLAGLEVWTTCAQDHRTWENFHPPGFSIEDGIEVTRFPVDARNLEVFIRNELNIQDGRSLSADDQLDWLSQSVNSRALYETILRRGPEFDAIVFAPYLFATSFWGALIHPDRSLLIPCLHDEPYAYQPVFRQLFARTRGLLFNARAEMELARRLYRLPGFDEKSAVVGMGFDPLSNLSTSEGVSPRITELLHSGVPYVLYSGRKERGKNLHVLVDAMVQYNTRAVSPLKLAVMGAGEIDFLSEWPEWLVDLGFVSEEEKARVFQGALALCQPSRNESFSIVLMEAWQHARPVIVHAFCDVTREHVVQAAGGLYFANAVEFVTVLDTLREDAKLCRQLGANGAEYVASQYSWPAVLARFDDALRHIGIVDDDAEQSGDVEKTIEHESEPSA